MTHLLTTRRTVNDRFIVEYISWIKNHFIYFSHNDTSYEETLVSFNGG